MDIDIKPSPLDYPDENERRSPDSPFSKITILIAIVFVWASIFAVIALAEPAYSLMVQGAIFVAQILSVRPSALLLGAAFAAYISVGLVALQSEAVRRIIKKANNLILKREKSFYLSTETGTIGESAKKFAWIEARLKSIEISTRTAQPNSKEDWEIIKQEAINSVVDNLSAEVSIDLRKKLLHDRMQSIWSGSLSRLSDQIIVLGSRANLTLWMGILFCTCGLFALWYSFFSASAHTLTLAAPGMEWVELAKSYAPRLTLVILIEVIGFFFLKMYRATLFEIRYVQNEITNVEMRALALNSAQSEGASTLSVVIDTLSKTDRNSIIEKGQTTVEIERQRASAEADKTALEAAVSLIHGSEKASLWRKS